MKSLSRSRQILTTREHAFVPCSEEAEGLNSRQLRELERLQARGSERLYEFAFSSGRFGVKFKQFAGVIHFSDGGTLEILPKVAGAEMDNTAARSLVMHMLQVANGSPARLGRLGALASSATLLDNFIDVTQREIWNNLVQGLDRTYAQEVSIDRAVRGRALYSQQISRFAGRHDKFVQVCPSVSSDTHINRVIAKGVNSMMGAVRDRKLRANLSRLQLAFSEFGVSDGEQPYLTPTFTRLNERWRPSYELCRQWLDQKSYSTRSGDGAVGPTLLFDMNRLFEDYVRAILSISLAGSVPKMGPGRPMFLSSQGRELLMLKPDVEVRNRGRGNKAQAIVCDVKWKNPRPNGRWSFSPDDLRQVYAYAKILGYSKTALIYPTLGDAHVNMTFFSQDLDPIELQILEFPIGKHQGQLREQLIDSLVGIPSERVCVDQG